MSEDFEALREELERVLGGLDDRQTQLRPTGFPDRWSIQQIIGHLLLTYAATEMAMDARIEKRTPTKARPTGVQRMSQFVVIRVGYFPRGRKAPEMVTPKAKAAVPGGVLIAEVDDAIAKLDRKVADGEKLFGPEYRAISHMILGPLSIRQWRRFHLIHGKHHIRQIAAIRKEHRI